MTGDRFTYSSTDYEGNKALLREEIRLTIKKMSGKKGKMKGKVLRDFCEFFSYKSFTPLTYYSYCVSVIFVR
jgi:hypothetical protein